MSELKKLVNLYRAIKRAQCEHTPMPDNICDTLTVALIQIENEMAIVPAEDFEDIKALFELVPLSINDEHFADSKAAEICQLAQLAAKKLDCDLAA